jgi:hypothetical protein
MRRGLAPALVAVREPAGANARPASNADVSVLQLPGLLTEHALAQDDADLDISVTELCGAVEVLVSGPVCGVWRRFDRSELHPAYVRHVMREMVKRYRASLGYRSRAADRFRKERG